MQLIKTKQKLLTVFTILSLHLASLSGVALAQSRVKLDTTSNPQVTNKAAHIADKSIRKGDAKEGLACVLNKGQQLADKLATLGQNLASRVLLPMQKSVFKGMPVEYVSSGSGELTFAVNDISFGSSSNISPLLFQRYYSSGSSEDAGLGRGWSFLYEERISVADGGRATLTNSFGEKFEYAAVESRLEKRGGVSMEFALQTLQPAVAQSFQFAGSDEIVEKTAAYKKTYRKLGKDFYLTNIQLVAGNKVLVERLADGRIAKVSHDDKFIQFKWTEGENPRLLSVVDNAGRRVDFVHRDGLLKSVRTLSGGKWAYSYKNGKLVKVLNPLGRVELKVEYEGERVARTSNEVSFKSYSYLGDAVTVTTSENYAQTYEHNAKGLVKRIYDREGVLAELEYDDAHRVISISNGKKSAVSFEYDKGGRLVRQQMPNGVVRVFEYDAGGKVSAISENRVRTTYTSDGSKKRAGFNLLQRPQAGAQEGSAEREEIKRFGKVDLVKVFDRDVKSEAKAVSASDEYDAVGRKVVEKLSDGTIIRYRYDLAGNVVRMWDTKSRELRAEYDALNSLTKVFNQHGWVRAERDRAGRIVKLENSDGQVREFVYNTDGALVKFKNAEGKEYRYFYTRRGKLKAVVNEKGRAVEYRLDANGNAVSTKRYWLDKDAEVTFGKISYRRNVQEEASFLKAAYRRDAHQQEQEDEDDDDVVNPRDVGLSDGFAGVDALRAKRRRSSRFDNLPCRRRVFGRCMSRRPRSRRPHVGFRRGIRPSFFFRKFRKDDCEKKCKKERKHDCDVAYDTCKSALPMNTLIGAAAGAGTGAGLGSLGGLKGTVIGGAVGVIVGAAAGVVSTYYECSAERYRCANTLRTLRECIKRCKDKDNGTAFIIMDFIKAV